MTLPVYLSRKGFIAILAFGIVAPAGTATLGPTPAMAQTFIENLLKGNAQKARPRRNRPSVNKADKRPAAKPETKLALPAAVPIPAFRPQPAPVATPEAKKKDPSPTPATVPLPQMPAPPEPKEPKMDTRVYQVACPAVIAGNATGKLLPPIEDGAQCGTHSPLSLTAIGKETPLNFANPVTTNCAMTVTLAQWSDEVTKAARDVYGRDVKITRIGTGSDYQCRKVNSASVGRASEHAFANALDIMSFTFSDGQKTELESGWNGSDKEKTFWRAVHKASCDLFMTVIGPDGDAAHRTNMHLDQGCHGKSCQTRICQ